MSHHDVISQQRKALAGRVLQRIADDPQFRRGLLDNPLDALTKAGFADEISTLRADDEVQGYVMAPADSVGDNPFWFLLF